MTNVQILKKYNIRPSKKLGQNFLIDKTVLRKIIEAANLSPEDTVLEIGPGIGTLTIELAKRVKEVIAVEKDMKLCEVLENVLNAGNVRNIRIISQNILKFNPYTLYPIPYTLIANLPYYITSPVIRKFLETKHKPRKMILMVQKEVAQRICARPPKMSILAVAVQLYARPKIISYVSKKSFWPQPKVDSAIIKMEPRNKTELGGTDTEKLFKLVKTGFSSKRKMLKNNLKIEESILEKIGLNPKARAENLSVKDWIKLYEEIYKN